MQHLSLGFPEGLSSARVVRCWLSPERAQPSPLVAIIELGTLKGLPVLNRRKVG